MPAFIDLFLPKTKHFGLSIGRTSIRGVEINSKGTVRVAKEVLLPDGVFESGVLINTEVFIQALTKLLEAAKFSTRYVAICFSEAHAYTRQLSLPVIPVDEIGEAVSWHVKDLFPFPPDEIYFDWKLIESGAEEYKIAVVAIQKKVLDSVFTALVRCGLKPLSFEPGAAALSRLLLFSPNQYVLVTEINRKGAYVTLVEGKKVLFTTVVNYTSEDTQETYLKNINQTISEIAFFYKNKGILKDESTSVLLTGELASQDWVNSMKEGVGYQIQILKTQIPNPAFNKAYAVAVSPVEAPIDENTINLLPEEIQKRYDLERNNIFYQNLLMRTCMALFVLVVISLSSFILLAVERQKLDSQVKRLTGITSTQKSDTQKLLLLNAQAKNIVSLSALRTTPKDKLAVINSILPAEVHISQWEYDDGKQAFTIQGEAKDRSELLTLKNKLEASDEFGNITLPLGSLESPKNTRFSITFNTK